MFSFFTSKPLVKEQVVELETELETKLLELKEGIDFLEESFSLLLNDDMLLASKKLNHSPLPFELKGCPYRSFGKAMITYQACMMSLEEDKIYLAIKQMLEAEELAASWSTNLTKFKSQVPNSLLIPQLDKVLLTLELISADCLLLLALISFLSQSFSEYARAALRLKRSFDTYSKLASQFKPEDLLSNIDTTLPFSNQTKSTFDSFLVSGICFGLGLFRLMLASMPKRAKSIVQGIGLKLVDREEAISNLASAIGYSGLHGSLSSLLLLSYYSGFLSFVPHVPCVKTKQYNAACNLITKLRVQFPDGRAWKLVEAKLVKLEGRFDSGAQLLAPSLDNPIESVPEITSLMRFEYGWIKLFEGDYEETLQSFSTLKAETNWSKAFYTYLQAACQLQLGDIKGALQSFEIVPTLIKKKILGRVMPIEAFVKLRSEIYYKLLTTSDPSIIMLAKSLPILELIYFFNGFHLMSEDQLIRHLKLCQSVDLSKVNSVELNQIWLLVNGTIHRELGQLELARQSLNQLLVSTYATSQVKTTCQCFGHFEFYLVSYATDPTSQDWSESSNLKHAITNIGNSELQERLQYRLDWVI